MARIRAVDPFGSNRRRGPDREPRPDPHDDFMAIGWDPADEPNADELLERIRVLDAEAAAEGLAVPTAGEGPDTGTEPHSDAQGLDGDTPEGWPTAARAAEVLHVDPAEVRRRCRDGELVARKDLSGAWRIDPASLGAS